MKDKDNVMKWLDEVDNMIMIMNSAVERNMPIDPHEAKRRFAIMRKRLKTVIDRVSGS